MYSPYFKTYRLTDSQTDKMESYLYFFKFRSSTSDSATMYVWVDVQLLAQLVVDMQLLPGVNVSSLSSVNMSSLPGMDVKYLACACVDVKYLACACAKQHTCVCVRLPT